MKAIGLAVLIGLVALVGCGKQETTPPAESTQPAAEQPEAAAPETAAAPSGIPTVAGDTITTDSGLKYIVQKAGDGATPSAGQMVTVHYTGWLTDGTKFDSSHDRGRPAQFPVGGLIKGWNEALATMKVGERRLLIIPPELAYGPAGRPGIPPNSTLIFDMELLAVSGAAATP